MASVRDIFRDILKSHDQSITKARLAVFDSLVGQEPLSMHELVQRAGQVDRASVYRAVDLFERLGVVQRLHTGWKYKVELTDKFNEHHHHLTCTSCGLTISLNGEALERFIDRAAKNHGFAPSGHQVEIQGLCRQCQP